MRSEETKGDGRPDVAGLKDELDPTKQSKKILEVLGEFMPGLVDLADACVEYQKTKFLEVREELVEAGVPERQATTTARELVVSAFAMQRRIGGARSL